MNFKNQLTLLITLLVFIYNGNTQDLSKYSFGLKLEPNINWAGIDSKSISAGDNGININYGLMVNYNASNKVSIATGVTIFYISPNIIANKIDITHVSKGLTLNNIDLNLKYNLRYIEIPLILTMHTNSTNNKSFFGEFGLSNAFLIRAKTDITGGTLNIKDVNINAPDDDDVLLVKETGTSNELSQKVSALRFGGIIGAGIKFGILDDSFITTGLRFNLGLNSFLQEDKWVATTSYGSLNIGFIF